MFVRNLPIIGVPDYPVEINRDHPVGANVVSCWILDSPGDNQDSCLVGPMVGQATPSSSVTSEGLAVQTNAAGTYLYGPDSSLYSFGSGEFTLGLYFSDFTMVDTRVLMARYNGAGDDYWLGQSTTTPNFSVSGTSASGPGVINDGKPHLLIGTRINGLSYCGVDYSRGSGVTSASSASPGGNIAISKFGTGASFTPTAKVMVGFVVNRGITLEEQQELSENIGVLFQPLHRNIYVESAAGGGSFLPAWARSNNLIGGGFHV